MVNGMIQHKYQAVSRGTNNSHFTSNVFISTPNNTQIILLSEMLSDLQRDLNNHNTEVESYILSLVFQYNRKKQLQGSVYYGKMK